MANHVSHAALPYPVKGARYTVPVPYLDADGDPTDPTTPDTERSIDGAAFADCTEEVTTITGSNGAGYLTLTGAETDCSLLVVVAKVASGPKATILTAVPRVLPSIATGTAQAGADGSITLASGASATSEYYTGCIVKTTGGTGGGGTGGASNQARVITAYNGSTKVATVVPNWETNPSNDTTYAILLTENAYCLLANAVQVGGTAQTARDLGASVLLSSGTGTGQISLSSGAVLLQATQTNNVVPTVTTVTNQLTAAQIATGVWQDSTAGDFTTASSIGKALYVNNVAPGGSGGHLISGSNAGTTTLAALTVTGATTLTGAIAATNASNDLRGISVNMIKDQAVTCTTGVTFNANVGTTQPINCTGTSTTAYVKCDIVDIAGAAVSTSTAQLGVNVVNAAGTAWGSGAITAASIANGAIDAATFAADVDAEIAAMIWSADATSYQTQGT